MFSPTVVRGQATPRIVELVGAPGSGKSAIAEILQQVRPDIHTETFPYFRMGKYSPFFARNSVRLAPELLQLLIRGKAAGFPSMRDVAIMAILTGWSETLLADVAHNGRVLVLDEGAICLMAKLQAFGSALVRSATAREWWAKAYARWGNTLDAVVMLDAPIPVLLSRVRARGAQYEMQEMPDPEACKHLADIQRCEESVVQELCRAPRSPLVFHVSTPGKQPEEIAEEIITLLRGMKAARPVHAEAG